MAMFDRVPEFVRRQRNLLGKTQEELARDAGLLKSHISKLETGRQEPRLSTFGRVLEGLGLDLAEFIARYLHFEEELRLQEARERGEEAGDRADDDPVRSRLQPYLASLPAGIQRASFEVPGYLVIVFPKP